MFGERRVSPLVRRYAEDRGWPFISISQPQHLFRRDLERRLPRVAVQGDPWQAIVCTEKYGFDVRYGVGSNPDDAVLAAIPTGLQESLRRLSVELDNLRGCLQK